MKPKPDELWKRLVKKAAPTELPASEDAVSRIVSRLRWSPDQASGLSWDEILLPLILRIALPCAAALLIVAALLPVPQKMTPTESVDALIAAAVEHP